MKLAAQFALGAVLALNVGSGVAAAESVKIGVFDPATILTDSKKGQALQEELNTFRIQKEGEIKSKGEEFKRLQDQYKASVDSMSPERREEIEADLTSRRRELERLAKDAEVDLQRRRQKAVRSLEEDVSAVLEEFGRKQGYTVILARDLCAFSLDAIDISADLVRLVDARNP